MPSACQCPVLFVSQLSSIRIVNFPRISWLKPFKRKNSEPLGRRYMRYEDKVGFQFMSDQARDTGNRDLFGSLVIPREPLKSKLQILVVVDVGFYVGESNQQQKHLNAGAIDGFPPSTVWITISGEGWPGAVRDPYGKKGSGKVLHVQGPIYPKWTCLKISGYTWVTQGTCPQNHPYRRPIESI